MPPPRPTGELGRDGRDGWSRGPDDAVTGMGGSLAPADRALVGLSATLAAWVRGSVGADGVTRALAEVHGVAEAAAVEEALLQSHLFLGYPAALNALALWRELRADAPPSAERLPEGEVEARGEAVCRTVYGDQYASLRTNVSALHPDMAAWMVREGYGRVMGRPGLELKRRELCIVAILAVGRWPVQLYSHMRGALAAGAGLADVRAALSIALEVAGPEARGEAARVWGRLEERYGERR